MKKKKRKNVELKENQVDYADDWIFASEGWDRSKGEAYFTQQRFKRLSYGCEKKIKN